MPIVIVMTIVFVATAARFAFLELAPPGFYIDEAAISAQVICLRQSGADLLGNHFPLFAQVLGGGYATPAYLYSGAAWTALFGDSIASFRGLVAFYSALFIGGTYVLGLRFWKSQPAAWLCALAAAISPWGFQFSRIAWDPALAPAFSVWAFAFLWVADDGNNKTAAWVQTFVGGICLSLAAYSYPPLRVQLAIITPFALYLLCVRERRDWKRAALFVGVATLWSLPLLAMTFSGELQARFAMLSVFNPDYLRQFGEPSFGAGLVELAKNFGSHFTPSYLVLSGDANLRHSTQSFGEWSWLDLFAVIVALVALIKFAIGKKLKAIRWDRSTFVVVGYLAGVLPAAMTWESNPHALRSIGATVFLALGVGGALHYAWALRSMRVTIIAISIAFLLFFGKIFALDYPQKSYAWFDTVVVQVAQQLAHQGRIQELGAELKRSGLVYDPMAIRYYELANGQSKCIGK